MAEKKGKNRWGSLKWLGLSVVVLVIDQWVKYVAIKNLVLNQPKKITPFLNFTLVYNKGSAFGFLSQYGMLASWLFASIAIIVSIILIYWLYRLKHHPWLAAAIAFILGGALGNLVNRFVFGYVIDFIDIHIHTWHWPAFNFADSAVFIGAVMIVIDALWRHPEALHLHHREEESKENSE